MKKILIAYIALISFSSYSSEERTVVCHGSLETYSVDYQDKFDEIIHVKNNKGQNIEVNDVNYAIFKMSPFLSTEDDKSSKILLEHSKYVSNKNIRYKVEVHIGLNHPENELVLNFSHNLSRYAYAVGFNVVTLGIPEINDEKYPIKKDLKVTCSYLEEFQKKNRVTV